MANGSTRIKLISAADLRSAVIVLIGPSFCRTSRICKSPFLKMMLRCKRFVYRRINSNDSRPTPELTGRERAAHKIREQFNDERNAIAGVGLNKLLCCARCSENLIGLKICFAISRSAASLLSTSIYSFTSKSTESIENFQWWSHLNPRSAELFSNQLCPSNYLIPGT